MSEILDRIHHRNPVLNRFLSPLIWVGALCVNLLVLILPYRGRVALSLIINVFFNRPIVYLNMAGQWLGTPLQRIQSALVYGVAMAPFVLVSRLLQKPDQAKWLKAEKNTDTSTSKYQS